MDRIPDAVIDYIYNRDLYRELDQPNDIKGKQKAEQSSSSAGLGKG